MVNLWLMMVDDTGWWFSHPSEKYESQLWMMTFLIYEKIKHFPNHQPVHVSGKARQFSMINLAGLGFSYTQLNRYVMICVQSDLKDVAVVANPCPLVILPR